MVADVDLPRRGPEHGACREFKKRREFLRLLADAADDRFDIVVVRDTSRIGGDTSRTMLAVEELRDEDVAVWCYIDGREVRLDDWRDKGMFALQSVAAEGERDAISSRTYEALMVRARAGFNAGGKNTLRRPVTEVNRACIDWITSNVLREEVVLEILEEVRRRLVERTTASESELTALTTEEKRLTRETANLAEAIARTGGSVDVLADELADRQRRLRTVQARRALLTTAPSAISLEVRRLEREARVRIGNLRELLERDQDSGRAVMEALLAEPLKFTPVQTPRGRRYRVEGTIATGALLQGVPPNADPDDPQCRRPQRGLFGGEPPPDASALTRRVIPRVYASASPSSLGTGGSSRTVISSTWTSSKRYQIQRF